MSPEEHARQVLAEARRLEQSIRRDSEEFQDFMATVRSISEPQGTKHIWNAIHEQERSNEIPSKSGR